MVVKDRNSVRNDPSFTTKNAELGGWNQRESKEEQVRIGRSPKPSLLPPGRHRVRRASEMPGTLATPSSPTPMNTLEKDITIFQSYCRTGRVPDLQSPEKTRKLGKPEMQAITSIVRHAISHGLEVPLGADVQITDDILRELPQMARRRAEREELARPAEHARAAKVFAQTIQLARGADPRRPVGAPALVALNAADVPEGFRGMYDALDDLVTKDRKWRSMRGAFRDFAILFTRNGVSVPQGVTSREQFEGLAEAAGLSGKRRNHLLSAWRKARSASSRDDLPDLKHGTRAASAGLSGCDYVPESLRLRPFAEQVQQLAPDLAAMRDEYVKLKDPAPETLKGVDGALSWLVAEHIRVAAERSGEEKVDLSFLEHLDPLDDFLTQHEAPVELTAAQRLRASKYPSTAAPGISRMRHLLDRAAVNSSGRSDLLMKHEGKTVQGAVWYTQALFHDLAAIRRVLYEFCGRSLEVSAAPDEREKWQRAQAEYTAIMASMKAHNKILGSLANHRDKGRLHATWPQLVFLGLPALKARVVTAREAWKDCGRKTGNLDSRRRRTLRLVYEERMIEYIVFAVLLADAMRIANYAGALVGNSERAHFQITFVRDGDGKPTGIKSVRIVFRRNDTPLVRLKKRDRTDITDREREKYLEPGLVDFELLWDYLTDIRPARLRRRGIKGAEEFSIEQDAFALFVAGRNGPNKQNRSGGFTTDALANIFGRTLHWVCVAVLRLNEREGLLAEEIIPSWRELENVAQWKATDLEKYERLSRWKALFAPHIVRNLYNVYFHGVRGNSVRAMKTTDDTLRTLVACYSVYSEDIERHMHDHGPSNPRWFDAAVDEIMRPPRPGDDWRAFWRALDPWKPEKAVTALRAA